MIIKSTTNYTFPKEYFKYVNRFLKEVGLYSDWIRFLHFNHERDKVDGYDHIHTNWSNRSNYSVVDVLGATNFSDFLKYCRKKQLPEEICSYQLFAAFLYHFYPSVLEADDLHACEDGDPYLIVDKEAKKARIRWK